MFSWVEFGTWQCIVAIDLLVVVEDDAVAYLPNEVVSSACAIPFLEDVPNTEPAVMVGEKAPRALQLSPELHETLLGVLNLHNQKILMTF